MPSKRKATGRKNNSLDLKKHEKLQAFLKDFDIEVERRKREMEKALNNMLITVEAHYSRAIMKLPQSVRQMNYLEYLAMGGSAEAVAAAEQKRINAAYLEVEAIESEILKDAAQMKTTRKRKQKAKHANDTVVNESENVSPAAKMLRKAKHGVTFSAKSRPPCTANGRTRRTSRTKGLSSTNTADIWGPTPLITPKFNPRLPKTATRVRKLGERVFSFTGSPLADSAEMIISVPTGDGQSKQFIASKITSTDLSQLDDHMLKSFEQLSHQLNEVMKMRK
ncbi:borealin [Mobula birostris]|uniref:borealin n=1 Tax=Mobula birostris TaxID=1983395 RepID=UPI003B27C78A